MKCYSVILVIIILLLITLFYVYNKIKKEDLVEKKIKCKSCKKINIVKGKAGEEIAYKCSECGKKGKTTLKKDKKWK